MRLETTHDVLERMLKERSVLSTRDVAQAARVSRQMAQKLLKALVDQGRLTIHGKARAAKYRPARVDDSHRQFLHVPRRALSPAPWIAEALQREAGEIVNPPAGPEAAPARVDDSEDAPVVDFRAAAQLWDSGSPYVTQPYPPLPLAPPPPRRVVLEVASAGSLYRLSARMLLADVEADAVVLDFTGVMDLEDEFLEEIFQSWAAKHPAVQLEVVHLPRQFAARVRRFARR